MFTTLATILLATTLIFGVSGVTVVAAQGSQPDQPLYSLKIWSEDTRLDIVTDPLIDFQLSLDFADRRSDEISRLLESGVIPPKSVLARYQSQVEQTIRYALNLTSDQTKQALEQIRTRLIIQQQTLLQAKLGSTVGADAVQQQLQQMLQERTRWVENGEIDPIKLREQLRLRYQQQIQEQSMTTEPTYLVNQTQSSINSGNRWFTDTPTPGSGYGPGAGTGDCTTCTPVGIAQGGNPYTTGTPTPGSGYGPGNGPDDQTTQGGSQPTTVPGKKGGN